MVDKSSDEFKRLDDYVKNTHAATHNQYELEIVEVGHQWNGLKKKNNLAFWR